MDHQMRLAVYPEQCRELPLNVYHSWNRVTWVKGRSPKSKCRCSSLSHEASHCALLFVHTKGLRREELFQRYFKSVFSFLWKHKSQHICLYGLHISWNSFRKLHEATNQEKLGRWLSVHKFYLLNFVVNDYVCNSVVSSRSLYLSHSIWWVFCVKSLGKVSVNPDIWNNTLFLSLLSSGFKNASDSL